MSNKFRTNQTPTNHTYCMWQLFMTMMEAGWSTLAWSDGTTANLTGTIPGPYATGPSDADPVFPMTGTFPTSGSSGANGLGNTRAWILMRQPKGTGSYGNYGGTRMVVIQRGTTNNVWKIKYSKAGNYAAGQKGPIGYATSQNAPSIVPSLTNDEAGIRGAGTDASPTFDTVFGSSYDGTSRHNTMANDGLSGETAPFGVWATGFPAGGGHPHHAILFDPCVNGTTAPQDADPYVWYVDYNGNGLTAFNTTTDGSWAEINGNGAKAWFRYGMSNPGQEFNGLAALFYSHRRSGAGTFQVVPGNSATDPLGVSNFNANDDLFPVPYGRRGGQGGNTGYKGVSSIASWLTTDRSTGDTFTLNTTRDRIYMRCVALPWDGSVPIV